MAIEELRHAAADDLRRFVERRGLGFPAVDWVWRALRTRGKLLGPEGPFCWGLLPPLACEAAGGDSRQALPLSTALECGIAAADLLDDVQDQDAGDALWRLCGLATATNVATFLLFLHQSALVRLADEGVPAERVVEAGRVFAAAGEAACSGQQRDLDEGSASDTDEAAYLSRTAGKSASLARCACRAGAVLGAGPESAVEALSDFGHNVGMALQISNDLVAISPRSVDRDDLRTGKRTLPIIYALAYAPEAIRRETTAILGSGQRARLGAEQVDRLRDLVTASGALEYTAVIADVYWERAQGCLERIDDSRARPLVGLLARMRSGWPR